MTTVLVSYETPALTTAMSEVLRRAGYQVLVAPPSDAMDAARRHGAVDMLVTDHPPLLHGRLDVAGCLKAEQPKLRVLYAAGL